MPILSYLVLARKSRPQRFSEVIGQEPVVRTLQNALTQGRVPHALMFSGVRGTGKTTLARIMAKALNCLQGPAAEPCNECRSCREITEGASVDLQEVDGASNRGIQEIRELKEKIRFMPANARHKIILIDEVHMLTTEAFNALLKTLEEPPAHVYFMFATTEPHKVPVTILSRCQRYELKRLGHRQLADHFGRLAAEEGVKVEPEALEMIAREAEGSVRDGLSLLDQIFSYGGGEISVAEVTEVLGLVSHRLVADLGQALLHGDLETIYRLLDQMAAHGTDVRRFGNDLLRWFRGLLVCLISQKPGDMLDTTDEELQVLQAVAAEQNLAAVSAMFQLLVEGVDQLAVSQQPRLALEMVFLRAAQIRDVAPVSELIARFDQILAGVPLPVQSPVTKPAVVIQPQRPAPEPVAAVSMPHQVGAVAAPTPVLSKTPPATTPAPAAPLMAATVDKPVETPAPQTTRAPLPPQPESPLPAALPNPVEAKPLETPSPEQTAPQPAPAPRPAEGRRRIRQHWDAFLKYIQERHRWMAAALQVATSVQREGDALIIHFNHPAECSLLKQREHVKTLTELALDFFQENLRIHFEVAGSNACDIDPANGMAPQHERRALANDPLVQTALDVFSGQIGDIRIGSRHRKNLSADTRATEGSAHLDD